MYSKLYYNMYLCIMYWKPVSTAHQTCCTYTLNSNIDLGIIETQWPPDYRHSCLCYPSMQLGIRVSEWLTAVEVKVLNWTPPYQSRFYVVVIKYRDANARLPKYIVSELLLRLFLLVVCINGISNYTKTLEHNCSMCTRALLCNSFLFTFSVAAHNANLVNVLLAVPCMLITFALWLDTGCHQTVSTCESSFTHRGIPLPSFAVKSKKNRRLLLPSVAPSFPFSVFSPSPSSILCAGEVRKTH